MKKIICAMLVVLFVFTLCACAAAEEPEMIPGFEPERDGNPDMDGYEFIFYAMTDYETYLYPEVGYSEVGDRILARYKNVGKELNVKMNVSAYEGDIITKLVTSANGGIKYADLVDIGAKTIYDNRDYFINLSDLDGFDITLPKWGAEHYLNTAKFNGSNYGFTAGYWGVPYPIYIGNLYFIKPHLTLYGVDNPQEFYENGMWTWDKFRELCRQATTTDPANKDNNTYGFVISDEMKFPRAWIISNGGAPIRINEEGQYYYALEEKNATEALQYIKDMLDEGIGYYTSNDAWEKSAEMFMNRKSLFFEAYNKSSFVNADKHLANPDQFPEGHSWVPYPCGPMGTYGQSTAQFWFTSRFLALPENFDEYSREADVIIINAIFEPLDGDTEDSWKERIERNFFFDDLSFKYYIELYEGGEPDYSTQAYEAVWNLMPTAYKNIISGRMTTAEAVEFIADKAQADIDKNLNMIN